MDDLREIEQLRDAKLRQYSFKTFRKYGIDRRTIKSKRARVLKQSFVVVYSLWHKKLLARTFYIEEFFEKKELKEVCYEVNRQLAGNKYKLYTRLFNSGCGAGFRVWKGTDDRGWRIASHNTYNVWGMYNPWTGQDITYYYTYNDPLPYLEKSVHKYSGWGYGETKKVHNNEMFEYLVKYQKMPQLEMLLKANLYHLLPEIKTFKKSKKGAAMLGVTKQEVKYLQTGISLKQYREIREDVLKLKLEAEEITSFADVKKYALPVSRKLLNYLATQKISASEYRDYLRYMDLLGMPKENVYLYPFDFKAAHEFQISQYKEQKDKKLDEAIERIAKENSALVLEKGEYIIRPAQSQQELINEGKILHHCVARYGEDMATRKTLILFVRKKDNKDVPLYTLELNGKRVIQFRAKHNGLPPKDAREFVKAWSDKNKFTCNL